MRPPTSEDAKRVLTAPRRNHPNASLATVSGSVSTLTLWAAGAIGIAMTAEVGAAIATILVTTSLLVGRKGIKGIMSAAWRGDGDDGDET
jgi:hypothetical protein